MKKFILKYKSYFYYFVSNILIGASILSFPTTIAFSALGDKPTISIENPSPDAMLNTTDVVISGTFTDENVQVADLLFTAFDQGTNISDSTLNPTEWNISDNGTPKTWTFTTTLLEGTHNITVEIKEKSPADVTMVDTKSIAFTINTTRPYISETAIILPDNTVRTGEDITRVPQDAKIKITLADDQPMVQLVNKIRLTTDPYNPIKVMLGTVLVLGKTIINDLGSQSGKYTYDIIFTPDKSALKINTTYLVYLDSNLVDDSNNSVYAKFFKFTTKSDMDEADNPHGHYTLNTNMCAACHSTHDSKSPSLIGGNYQTTFNEQLKQGQPVDDPSQNYCMACHDGTMNAPIIDKNDRNYRHNNPVDYSKQETNALKQPESCTSCHNPHMEWSEENPNLLKDHFVYTHNAAHPDKGLDSPIVDSLDISCNSCHDYINFSTISSESGHYEKFDYKKSLTAESTLTNKLTNPILKTVSDYSLCLRCHNSEKNEENSNLSDIEKYYLDPNSGHNFTLPPDKLIQKDGSKLNGPIPCAECHETHGSDNIMNLRELLGNNAPVSDADKFVSKGTIWNGENERSFCLKCHNRGVDIYGRTATFMEKNSIGAPITGHRPEDTNGCSECHSTGETPEKRALSAAHAPKKIAP